jgi:creatinine amidohydrolase/Fe(II)-dependent formamide hydrolase-like protein
MREVRWERMFPDQLDQAFQECPLVYFTYGLCEPHGPQNAVGLDALKAHGIACRAAETHGGIVAPPDYWHWHESGGAAPWLHQFLGQNRHSWMTCLPPWQHFKNVCYHIRMADVLGFHAAILLTGHYGPNYIDLNTMIERVQPHVGCRLYSLPDKEANQPGFDRDGESTGDHAGRVETSLLWALEPGCVDQSRLPPAGSSERPFAMGHNARESDRRVGERMLEDEVRWLGKKAAELLADHDRVQPAPKLCTYEDVEKVWESVIKPVLKTFHTMQDLDEGQEPVPEDSIWHANWRVPDRG